MRNTWLGMGMAFAVVVAAALSGCGSDDGDNSSPGSNGSGGSRSSEAPPADLTGQQVCDLVPSADVASALSVEVTSVSPNTGGTPSCSYNYRAGATSTNFLLSAMRAADVNGLAGRAAFDYAVEQNRRFAAGAPEKEVSGVGDRALFMDGAATKALVVQSGPQVLVLVGSTLTEKSAGDIAKVAVSNLD